MIPPTQLQQRGLQPTVAAQDLAHIPPQFLQGGGLTNLPITALSPMQRQQLNLLSQGLGQFRRIPATPALRQQLLSALLAGTPGAPQVPEISLARLINNLALASQGMNLPPQDHIALSRNLTLLLNHGAQLPDQQAQALLGQTFALMQQGGVQPWDLQLIADDLSTILGQMQTTATAQPGQAQQLPGPQFQGQQNPGQQFQRQQLPGPQIPEQPFRGQRAPGQQIQLFENPQPGTPPQPAPAQPAQPAQP
jgi:hypothetical protein